MKRQLFTIMAVSIIFALMLPTQIVHAAVDYNTASNTGWINLNNTTTHNSWFLHDAGDGNNLEFASKESNGTLHWQILNINKNGNVAIGTSANPDGSKLQVNATSGWAGRFMNEGSDVRMAFPGHGIFVTTTSNDGRYLLQLNRGTLGVFQVNSNGNAYLDGTLRVKELLVKSNVWADYVFNNDYTLMPLPELEEYINLNSHLPNIPSQAEVTSNGISIGEMQTKQMSKIEELTLYIIQLQKEIDVLKQK